MKLRVPDYYEEFSCIADQCKDSCCIGWEIDIDEDTYSYYENIQGAFGRRLQENMFLTEDGFHCFRLKEHGRCPFLNERNLCDLCIELGEESLCEVCTEYPRFTLEYGEVLQKTLSLSCEEVGRILFSKENPVSIVERELSGEERWKELEEDYLLDKGEDGGFLFFCENVQENLILLLQDRSISIWQRIRKFLLVLQKIQNLINENPDKDWKKVTAEDFFQKTEDQKNGSNFQNLQGKDAFLLFFARFSAFCRMETLDVEWEQEKEALEEKFTRESYGILVKEFLSSGCYLEKDYEHLMVYFTFRYFMNCVYDYDMISYGKMAVIFTLMIRDMDVLRFIDNQRRYNLEDRIDIARIFSKEVEHSMENVEYAKEEFMFGEEFSIEKLCAQI